MTVNDPIQFDDEIDLRGIIQTLLNRWKFILLISAIAGIITFGLMMLMKPVYSASAMVSIDQEVLGLSINPVNYLLSDKVRNQVAGMLRISVDELPALPNMDDEESYPRIRVSLYDTGETTFIITVEGTDEVMAMKIANAWADAGIEITKDHFDAYGQEEILAQTELQQAEKALTDYLAANNLSDWTWADLTLLTGIGQQSTILLADKNEILPMDDAEQAPANDSPNLTQYSPNKLAPISLQQRFEISQLMRRQIEAVYPYDIARTRASQNRYAVATTPPNVLSYAVLPDKPISPNMLKNIAFGIISGSLLSIFCVFVKWWWQNSDETSKE